MSETRARYSAGAKTRGQQRSLYLSEETMQRLREIAEREERSVSQLVERLLRRSLDEAERTEARKRFVGAGAAGGLTAPPK